MNFEFNKRMMTAIFSVTMLPCPNHVERRGDRALLYLPDLTLPSPKRRGKRQADRNRQHSHPQRSRRIREHAAFWLKISGSNREQRKPMLLLVFVGLFLLRLAERTLLLLLFHAPPRSTPLASLQTQTSQP